MKKVWLYLVTLFFALFVANLAGNYSDTNLLFLRVVLALASVIIMLFGTFKVYEAGVDRGTGNLAKNMGINLLELNEIYETLSVTPHEKEYLVFIRDREGKVLAYRMLEVPPKVFKVVREDGTRLIQAYPNLSLVK